MKAADTVRLVAEREIRQRLRGKAFYVSTAVIVLAVFAIADHQPSRQRRR